MQLIFVRHAQPRHEIRDEGIADPGLSELGHWQAERLVAWLRHEPVDAVWASPKRRALETVRPLADHLGLDITIDPELDEIDRRSSVYLPTELLPTEGGAYWQAITEQRWDDIGWDSPSRFQDRVGAAFDRLRHERPGARVVVGCHGGVIRSVLVHALGPDARVSLAADYASITRLTVAPGGEVAITSVNETGHFDADRVGVIGPMRAGDEP